MSVLNSVLDFVQYVLGKICKSDDQFTAEIVEDDRGSLILVKASPEDMGRIIGREGKSVAALRTLVTSMAAREGLRVSLKVEEK